MIPIRNLWEIKASILDILDTKFGVEGVLVGDNMLKREPYETSTDYKICRVSVSWIPDKQRVSMKGTLYITLYYDKATNIEIDMGRISDYLQYGDIEDDIDITEIRETYWETDHWMYNLQEPNFRDLISEDDEGILPMKMIITIFPK